MQNHQLQKQLFATRSAVTLLALSAMLVGVGCAEIKTAKPEDADELANLRTDRERDEVVLVEYQKLRKKEVESKGGNPDDLDVAAPLKEEPRFKELWDRRRKEVYASKIEKYKALSADVVTRCLDEAKLGATTDDRERCFQGLSTEQVKACLEKAKTKMMPEDTKQCFVGLDDPAVQHCAERAKAGVSADDIDRCVISTPAVTIDPTKAGLLALAAIGLAVLLYAVFRTARRRIDPVAQAGQKLNLAVQQGSKETTVTGEYKGYALRLEASAPEVGEGDGFVRVIILSKVDPHTLVRFGPLAPPTGLDLPDLDAPEVHDTRVPEGYKLRLSPGTNADAMLAGDLAFQLRDYDPVDVRVHDGMCGVTVWQVPQTSDRVIDFIELAVNCAKQYPQT